MSEFTHSIVLFTGDDGLPLEFNILYASNKPHLKAIIEHGGGMCTLSDNSTYLVSPGTKVLNVDPNKKLISTKYIYDCVKENVLFETDQYRFEINEIETSDISDNSANLIGDGRKSSDNIIDNSIDIIKTANPVSPNELVFPRSNHDFDFEDSESRVNLVANKREDQVCQSLSFSSLLSSKNALSTSSEEAEKNSERIIDAVPDSLDDLEESIQNEQNLINNDRNLSNVDMEITDCAPSVSCNNTLNRDRNCTVDAVIVSSSQPFMDGLDKFDNMVLNKAQENPVQEDEGSQSYTVSSSADAQVSPKAPLHNISAEIFDGSPAVPDSASQNEERQQYIKELESEIDQILKKPSPKSIQDKIVLVKYICIVKKLPPAIVLQTLQNI